MKSPSTLLYAIVSNCY